MASHCDDVSARMMDLLYGELSAAERAEIDAHVAGCARCRSELEGFQKTRAVARQALDDGPPARARAAIMKAAAAHLATQAQAQPAPRQAAAPARVSFWDRLRVRWAFPTLATVGALAVFLVANRVFQHPEQTMERVHEASRPVSPTLQTSPSARAPQAINDRMDSPRAEPEAAPPPAAAPDYRYNQTAQQGARFRGHGKWAAAPAAEAPARAPKHVATSGNAGYGSLSKDSAGAGAPPSETRTRITDAQKPRSSSDDDALDRLLDEGTSTKKSAHAADNEKRSRRSDTQFAQPPPPREETAAKTRAKEMDKSVSAPAMKQAPTDDLLDSFERGGPRAGGGASGPGTVGGLAGRKNKSDSYGSGAAQPAPQTTTAEASKRPAPPVAAAPAPPPPPPAAPAASAPASRAQGKGGESYDAEDVPLARDGDSKAEKKMKKAGGKANATETLAQRADRLFSEGRWNEAAAAYRELLRQDPRGEDATRWRRRLVAAENADLSERNASLAEKRALEAKPPAKAAPPKAAKAASKKASGVMLDSDEAAH